MKKLTKMLFSSIIKQSKNDLPFTAREGQMVKWFIKFQILTLVIISAWIYPLITLNSHITSYNQLIKENVSLRTKNSVATTKRRILTPEIPGIQVKSVKKTPDQVKDEIQLIAEEHNFPWIDYLLRLAGCESEFNSEVRGKIDKRDRGVFQINSYWHSEVSDECAFNVRCATEWTMWRIESGHQNEWICDKLI